MKNTISPSASRVICTYTIPLYKITLCAAQNMERAVRSRRNYIAISLLEKWLTLITIQYIKLYFMKDT